jgi:alkylhydroperoxidase/carboxymuconolactone decarboxylase family protein
MNIWIKVLIFSVVIVAVILIVVLSGLGKYLSLEQLARYQADLKLFVSSNYFLSVAAYIGIYFAAEALAIKKFLKNREIKENVMDDAYYEKKDLSYFADIGEFAADQGKSFFDYYARATSPGVLTEREKALIALSVAVTQHCPYCIDACTNKCLSLGVSSNEMMESVHVGAAILSGATLAHSTQMRKIIKKKAM